MATRRFVEVDASILAALAEGAMTTAALAREVGEESRYIYSRCKKLEQKGLITSKLSYGRTLYCIDDEKVVTRLEYETCNAEGHELRTTSYAERSWRLA